MAKQVTCDPLGGDVAALLDAAKEYDRQAAGIPPQAAKVLRFYAETFRRIANRYAFFHGALACIADGDIASARAIRTSAKDALERGPDELPTVEMSE